MQDGLYGVTSMPSEAPLRGVLGTQGIAAFISLIDSPRRYCVVPDLHELAAWVATTVTPTRVLGLSYAKSLLTF